ncbi:cupin domain-containing protein [Hoeflea sp.]|uniref:cupin domain-containing protein n=1 Tax=Hoeflea sp. TaxID=1940281 RepID=UPI003749334F
MPVIKPAQAIAESHKAGEDDPHGLGPYDAVLLSDSGGLTQFGAFLETLHPGSQSSRQHWHENEDEFIYMISSEVVLLENDTETTLEPGDAATFKAGTAVFHCLQNRSDQPATYVVVGNRAEIDVFHYLDDGSRVERKGRKRTVFNAQGEIVREFER